MSSHDSDDSLFEAIPAEQLTREQVARWRGGYTTPTYKLRREPETLYELELYGPRIAFWMDNGTLVQVTQNENYSDGSYMKKSLSWTYSLDNPGRNTRIAISGQSDDAIADTAMFWWGLHCPEECNPLIMICNQSSSFDFGVIKTKHLSTLFSNNWKRRLLFNGVRLNVAQSVFLATRDHPIDLTLEFLNVLEDGGDAFVNALQTRGSNFGALHCLDDLPISNVNVARLVQLNLFEKLTLPVWNCDVALLPFYAPVKALTYTIDSAKVLQTDLQSLNILAEELTVTMNGDNWIDAIEVMISLLCQLANLGHFKHLDLRFELQGGGAVGSGSSKRILQELARTVAANQGLKSVNFVDWNSLLQAHHVKDLLESFEDHKQLRTITIEINPDDLGPLDFSFFKQLLSRNRYIEVHGNWMADVVDIQEIENLYSFNRFFNGSETLRKSSQSDRTTLIGTTLTESASGDLQRSALVMASYTDSLCEFIETANMECLAGSEHTVAEETNSSSETGDAASRPKRRRT